MIVYSRFKYGRKIFVANLAIATLFSSSCRTNSEEGQVQSGRAPAVEEPTNNDAHNPMVTDELDAELGEEKFPNEDQSIANIIEFVEGQVKQQQSNIGNRALRDAHPKAHGCVRASFTVNPNIPKELAQGVFKATAPYKAWIRFSNGNPNPLLPDSAGDARGMAIKLTGVSTDSSNMIMGADTEKHTQDFVMINLPTFFSNDPAHYIELQKGLANGMSSQPEPVTAAIALSRGLEPGAFQVLLKLQGKLISNPLTSQYWSMVPYRLGTDENRKAIKFSAIPCDGDKLDMSAINRQDNDFLQKAMAASLAAGKEACFNFAIQVKNNRHMQIENSIEEWPSKGTHETEWNRLDTAGRVQKDLEEGVSRFVNVAQIRIPAQVFNTKKQQLFCDNLSFTPWHSLQDHRPLGAINRVRRPLYEAISKKRHGENSAPRTEPDGTETF
jgi:hypothetical protein